MKYIKTFENYYNDQKTLSLRKINTIPEKYLPLQDSVTKITLESIEDLVELPELPPKLEILVLVKNKILEILPNIPNTLDTFICEDSPKIKIENLPENIRRIAIKDCELTNLELPNNLEYLDLSYNNIKSLILPEKLHQLNINDNYLEILPIIPNSLKILKCYQNNWTKPIPYKYMVRFNLHCLSIKNSSDQQYVYTEGQFNKFSSFEFQKEFLEREPENYLDLKPIGYAKGLDELFPHLFDMDELGLID